jgi:hypothetical protein
MNVPALKCARGYHKRGRKFKVLYFCATFAAMVKNPAVIKVAQ